MTKLAVMWCRDIGFQRWVAETFPHKVLLFRAAGDDVVVTKHVVRDVCKVESRREFDRDPHAALRFETQIRKPFMQWVDAHKAHA